MLNDRQKETLSKNVSGNLEKLLKAMDWTQAKLAEKLEIVPATISNYINGTRIPPVEFLVSLCLLEDFKNKGLELTLDLLTSEKFNPQALLKKRSNHPSVSRQEVKHSDFLGTYLCYLFDQSKSSYNQDPKSDRELRFGVISIFDDCESLTGETTIRSIAAFFKDTERESAAELKKNLDAVFDSDLNPNLSLDSRNMLIEEQFKSANCADYEGTVTFSDHHVFIKIQSNVYEDNALIILYSPQKKANEDYIGGIGSLASISRGRAHMPTAQKIILSKYRLSCCNEEIAEKLSMSQASVDQQGEAEAICAFCRKLYSNDEFALSFDENDKVALIKRRLDQLVRNYINKNICCVGSVSEDEDKAVFKLIEQSMA